MELAILVRGSPFYLLLPLGASVWLALRRRHAGVAIRTTATYLFVPAAVLTISLGLLPRLAFPEYAASGRLYVNVWHHIFVGFGTSPYFPFPGLSERYPCPDIPEGLVHGTEDRNGQCIWSAYVHGMHMSPSEAHVGIYSGEYERALLHAVYHVIRNYPGKVLKNVLYYKPLLIVDAVAKTWPSLSSPLARPVLPLALLQIVLFIGFVAARPEPRPFRDAASRLAVLLPFLISVQIPLLVAWATPWTIVDLLTYLFCGVEIGLWLVLAFWFKLVRETELFGKVRSKLGYGD